MKKAISIFTAFTTILWLVGAYLVLPVGAVTFKDGDLAREADEFDVYIIKLVGAEKFKRLILNPDVFNMYGHLKWSNVQVVADGTLSAYTTSELVRAAGDEKVYKLFPDGDTGTKKWVESLDCFTSSGFNWNSVYVINSFDRDSYTTSSASYCGGAVVEGDITLSLAADTPAATALPYNAHGVPFLKFKVAGTGTITQMAFKRSGVGDATDFVNVYLYEGEKRLTSGRSISSSTNKTTFIGLSIKAPTTITFVGDLANSSGDNGHINYFSIESASDITSAATVGGSFPIAGNSMSITSIEGGTLTVVDNGSLSNPTVGQKNAQITQFKITGAYEPIDVYRVTLYNGGIMNSTEITNLKLKDVGGTVVATATACTADDLCTLVFDSPYRIPKGESKIFKLYADLAGDKDDTIILYFEVSADIKGIGATYGAGTYVDVEGMNSTSSGECHSLTLEGGELTIAFNGPVAADVSDDTDDTVFLDFSFTAASNLEIRKMKVYFCFYNEGSSSNIDANIQDELDDIKLKDKDSGTILMGPTDGDNWTLETTNVVCSNDEIYKEWTDIWDIDAGETKNLQITGDIAVSSYTDAADGWKAVLRGYANLTNPVKYRGTNDYVASADIVPSTDITGNLMTIESSSISVALATLPVGAVDKTKGQTKITAMGLVFTAGDASDMTLTDLVLTGYVKDQSGGTYAAGAETSGDTMYAKNVVTNVCLYEDDGTTKISGPKSFSGGTSDSDVTFDDLSWKISAGQSKKVLVVVDITTTATSSTYDYVYFEIEDYTDITALDSEGNSRNVGTGDDDLNTSPTVYVRKADGGTLTLAVAPDGIRRDMTYVYQGQKGAEFSKFKLTSTIEAFKIDKVMINMDNSTATTELKYISKVELSYPIDAAGTLVSPRPAGSFGSVASIAFSLTGKEMYVPKDDYAYLTIYADLATYTEAGAPVENDFGLDIEGGDASDFHAVGVGSSRVIEGATSYGTIADTASAEQMYIVRAFPSFTLDRSTGGQVSSGAAISKVIEFTITNHGDYELVFNSTSGEITFDVLGSGAVSGDAVFKLYSSGGTEIDSATAATAGAGAASASFTGFSSQITIPKNSSQAFYIKIYSGASLWDEQGDWLALNLRNEAAVLEWVDGGTATQLANTASIKYIGVPMDGPVWNIGW